MKKNLVDTKLVCIPFLFILFCFSAIGQDTRTEVAGIPINYYESKVPSYTLPNPLVLQSGKRVSSAKTWTEKRRKEILELFEREQFGKSPDRKPVSFNVFESGTLVFNGTAIRKQVTIYFTDDTSRYKADLLIYLPAKAKEPAPLFLNIRFATNCLSVDDPGLNKE